MIYDKTAPKLLCQTLLGLTPFFPQPACSLLDYSLVTHSKSGECSVGSKATALDESRYLRFLLLDVST